MSDLNDQMEVISYQAMRYHTRRHILLRTRQLSEKGRTVAVIDKNVPTINAARHGVVNSAVKMNSWISPHHLLYDRGTQKVASLFLKVELQRLTP